MNICKRRPIAARVKVERYRPHFNVIIMLMSRCLDFVRRKRAMHLDWNRNSKRYDLYYASLCGYLNKPHYGPCPSVCLSLRTTSSRLAAYRPYENRYSVCVCHIFATYLATSLCAY